MSKENNGGPAFPVLHSIDGNLVRDPLKEFTGMALRDYFAAKVCAAVYTNSPRLGDMTQDQIDKATAAAAKLAYAAADAMLMARDG